MYYIRFTSSLAAIVGVKTCSHAIIFSHNYGGLATVLCNITLSLYKLYNKKNYSPWHKTFLFGPHVNTNECEVQKHYFHSCTLPFFMYVT